MEYYTIKDIQKKTGLGYSTVYKLVQVKGFPKIKIGNRIIVPIDKFEKWMEDNIGNKIDIG